MQLAVDERSQRVRDLRFPTVILFMYIDDVCKLDLISFRTILKDTETLLYFKHDSLTTPKMTRITRGKNTNKIDTLLLSLLSSRKYLTLEVA